MTLRDVLVAAAISFIIGSIARTFSESFTSGVIAGVFSVWFSFCATGCMK